ncbi:MAG: HAMP domain-containing histidine kinase [Candidatus Saccharibacteria bacterium]|nr:HAMP domain-containing histidine kinase [Candidatus Saccharibacteria bacterium]
MFKKLRNKFILTNIIFTTLILAISFGSIFAATAISNKEHPPRMREHEQISSEMREAFDEEIKQDREQRLERLGITLLLVAVMTELLVFIASYYYAEKSIKPVKDAYDKQREFIANASHELKTPIAAARANFEALGTTEEPWTNNVDSELDRAAKLVNDLLVLARTDGRTVVVEKKDVDLVKIVKKHTQLIEARLGDKKLELNLPEKAEAKIVKADFEQVLDILLDNAVKYSKSKIEVTLSSKSLMVKNDGKTIPQEKLAKVFDRFYQTDKTADGSGLGLAIARAVVDQNNWKIGAESDKKTTSFILKF